MRYFTISALLITLFIAGCKPSVTPQNLYGKWKYIRVQNPNANPPDSVHAGTLIEQKPYIEFTRQDSLLIYWDGKVLSHGTFTIDGQNIRYKEILADGKIREFPFFIDDFKDNKIIFSTKGTDGSEVTAVKQ